MDTQTDLHLTKGHHLEAVVVNLDFKEVQVGLTEGEDLMEAAVEVKDLVEVDSLHKEGHILEAEEDSKIEVVSPLKVNLKAITNLKPAAVTLS